MSPKRISRPEKSRARGDEYHPESLFWLLGSLRASNQYVQMWCGIRQFIFMWLWSALCHLSASDNRQEYVSY